MVHMSSITVSTTTTGTAPVSSGPEQLTLLAPSGVSARFQLSHDTRARGLRHIAEIRQMLAASTSDEAAHHHESQRAA